MSDALDRIEFRRRIDGLTYVFLREETEDGCLCYRRTDLDLLCQWVEPYGWAVVPANADTILSIPWECPAPNQSPDCPPQGIWVSRKNDKSYVYELVFAGS